LIRRIILDLARKKLETALEQTDLVGKVLADEMTVKIAVLELFGKLK